MMRGSIAVVRHASLIIYLTRIVDILAQRIKGVGKGVAIP